MAESALLDRIRDNPPLRRVAARFDRRFPWHLLYRGDRLECPCCGGHFRGFRARDGRPDARCPGCNSFERHRVLWMWMRDRAGVFEQQLDVLHIAPEAVFESRMRALPNLRYTGGDLFPTGEQVRVDLTAVPFDAGSFDLVICNHVLDEIPDDRLALREIHRVLRPGGRLVTQTAVHLDRESSFEDPSLSAEERRRVFGTVDDVRVYGRDFADRLAEPGFDVTRIDYVAELDPATVERHALREQGGIANGSDIYVAVKNAL
jgi:SAM-dependent methyltransferase